MFERFTEKARRAIFFSRYEASQYGSSYIETDHLLLGMLREATGILRWAPQINAETVRKKIDDATMKATPISTSIDLPLSKDCKTALEFAKNEADRLAHKHIGTEHLFLGLLDVEKCFAAQLLREGGADAGKMREELSRQVGSTQPQSFQRASFLESGFRTLSAETVEVHGKRWNVDYIHDVIKLCRSYNWHWHKAVWKPRDVAVHRKTGRVSFDLDLAADDETFELAPNGWKKDHCFICRWELYESDDPEHGMGYTNGHDWLCMECYQRFWDRPDFFSSSQIEIT
ncbi:MAG: Clp protease N-terminal domain-containing protein [Candidatus Sulfotelmatobacter sp.]